MSAYGERIVRVEVELIELKKAFEEHKDQTARNFKSLSEKLDELLVIRHKGAGVLWLLGGAGMSGIFIMITQALSWFRS